MAAVCDVWAMCSPVQLIPLLLHATCTLLEYCSTDPTSNVNICDVIHFAQLQSLIADDTLQVLLNGQPVAHLDRNVPQNITLPSSSTSNAPAKLSVVVEAMGRVNFGCVPDTKGLQSQHVRLDGAPCRTSQ